MLAVRPVEVSGLISGIHGVVKTMDKSHGSENRRLIFTDTARTSQQTTMTPNSTRPLTTNASDLDHATPRRLPTLSFKIGANDHATTDISHRTNEPSTLASRTALSSPKSSPVRIGDSAPTSKKLPRPVPERKSSLRQPQRQPRKKKSSSVLGFLALKEPSTVAFEEFAEQERKRAGRKGGKAAAVIMPGVSSQKLPEHVPKVNSKWDGLPPMIKKKDKDRLRDTRSSTTTMSSYTAPTSNPQGKAGSSRKGTFLYPPSPTSDNFDNEAFLSTPPPPLFSHKPKLPETPRHDSATTSPSGDIAPHQDHRLHTAETSWFSDADDAETEPVVTFLDASTAPHPSQRNVTYKDSPSVRSVSSTSVSQTYSDPKTASTTSFVWAVLRSHTGKPKTASTTSSASGVLRSLPDRTDPRAVPRVSGKDVRGLQGVQTEGSGKRAGWRTGEDVEAMREVDVLPWEMFEPPAEGEGLVSAASSIVRGGRPSNTGAFGNEGGTANGGGKLKRLGRTFGMK
ncbi:hypothetical protein TI39_contig370g00009 [Zymoseptoria brevis]|uniref:Uncharacterized protein n=1 Tax=Zymoseptoria brevis TaxID=1047168 RepID=A0A0F4GQ40_9PEZI|nr:hypothetical protein TI39_contig370g00009 [Zymoseptoria brevis]